jgi:hypothetical protein
MRSIAPEDLRASAKVLQITLDDERFRQIANLVSLNFEINNRLRKVQIPPEIEPTTYLAQIMNKERA